MYVFVDYFKAKNMYFINTGIFPAFNSPDFISKKKKKKKAKIHPSVLK